MRFRKSTLLTILFLLGAGPGLYGTPDNVTIDIDDNYNDWGWEVLVIRNNYITLAILPSLGARVLQYDLGVDTFMIINEDQLGQTYDPATNMWGPWTSWGYGGYKTWPAPQSEWNWPPPPYMAWGVYSYEVQHASDDSVVVWMNGQTETQQTPGLRFERTITAYRNSTRVKVETELFNENSSAESWGIWDVTQTIVRHAPENDYSNFSAYIPVANSADLWDDGGGPEYNEVLPGIYEVKFVGQNGKMFSTASEGWSCFVDERDSQCYAKLFDLVEGADYPDGGANVEYYTNGGTKYLEMEILGPIESIPPDGSIRFTEDWYVATSSGPMYTANPAGIVRTPLGYSRSSQSLTGSFAAFSEGEFKLSLRDADRVESSSQTLVDVSPLETTTLEESLIVPEGIRYVCLDAYDVDGNFIATLDQVELHEDDSFTAYKAPEEPVIDGLANEAFWDTTSWYPLDYVWLPYNDIVAPDDFTGRFKIAWTEENLLLLVEVVDDSLYDGHPAPLDNYWNDDCVEVFLDEDHSGGNHQYNYNAFAYHVGIEYDVVDNGTSTTELFNDNVEAMWTREGDTYTWELAVKVFDDTYVNDGSSTPVTLTNQKEMGFSLAYCDNDGSPQRENFIGSKYLPEAVSNDSYINASLFGTLTLIDPAGNTDAVNEIATKNDFTVRLFPNPASDRLFYHFSSGPVEAGIYQIRSITGQLIGSGNFKAGISSGSIILEKIPAGIYFITFRTGEEIVSKQICIR